MHLMNNTTVHTGPDSSFFVQQLFFVSLLSDLEAHLNNLCKICTIEVGISLNYYF
jgi:hypothetical protein